MIIENKNCQNCSKYKGYQVVWKEVGGTPLEVIQELKEEKPELKDEKMAYAGRLDPMAEGKLLILIGDTCKERDKYLGLDKEYEFEILLGFKSDTQDILGIAEKNDWHTTWIDKHWFNQELQKYLGKIKMKYPIFSSRTVKNKPLFLWTLEGKIDEIEIPEKESQIYDIKLVSFRKVKGEFLKNEILEKIEKPTKVVEESKALGKDYRREEVRKRWKELLKGEELEKDFLILKIKTIVSSGTYMRTLAEKIAFEVLEDYGLAYSIKRTKIGRYGGKVLGLHYWKKSY